jgi:hypothetical protein
MNQLEVNFMTLITSNRNKNVIYQTDNASTIISNEILRNVWNKAKYVHIVHPQILIDISDGVNYITCKNKMLDELLYESIRNEFPDFNNFKPKQKRELSNRYFDTNLAGQHRQLIEKTLNGLIILKQQISPDIVNNQFETAFQAILSLFPIPE